MRILHTADWHIGELNGPVRNNENARMQDTLNCIDYLIQQAEIEQPDITLIAGDIFNKSQLWGNQMVKEINIAIDKLKRLNRISPVVLLFGTENHENIRAFELIWKAIPDLHIIINPELIKVTTKSGVIQVAGIPGFDKGYFRTKFPGMSKEEENKICSNMLGDIVLGLSAQLEPNLPSVLMAHYSVAGCETESGMHIFMQNDVVLPTEALEASGFDLVCLGHIHKAQQLNTRIPAYYCGSINGLTFNEEGQDKGFWLHYLDERLQNPFSFDDAEPSKFIKTPSREFRTLLYQINPATGHNNITIITEETELGLLNKDVEGKIIRVHYEADEETEKQLNKKQIEKALLNAGAFWVSEIRPVKILQNTTKQELTENSDPITNLNTWLEAEGLEEQQVKEILELARPMIEKVSAKMPTGKLNGTFEPLRLKVNNYRSYKEEEFDFTQVQFATVNGPNGIGKSAFFMDAICDCLYEEPREGELTGWITNGEKSGMMEFEFKLDTHWKVIRTRTRSGKVTLALQQFVNGEWVNRSESKKDETQKKIIDLLGMDCKTFRIVCAVMQDGYGLFMEADKESRMQVLSEILGLSIYEKLEKEAVELRKEVNREVKNIKEKIAALDEELKEKTEIVENLKLKEITKKTLESQLGDKEKELRTLQDLVASLKAMLDQEQQLKLHIDEIEVEIKTKIDEKKGITEKMSKAQNMIFKESCILDKVKFYESTKELVTTLKAKLPRLQELRSSQSKQVAEINKIKSSQSNIQKQITDINKLLAKKEQIEMDAAEYEVRVTEEFRYSELQERHNELEKKHGELTLQEWQLSSELENEEIRLKNEKERIEQQIQYLENSGCIDIDLASCQFLREAKKDREMLPEVQEQLNKVLLRKENELAELVKAKRDIEAQIEELDYSSDKHKRLKEQIKLYKPAADLWPQLKAKEELLVNLQQQLEQSNTRVKELNEEVKRISFEIGTLEPELQKIPALEKQLALEPWLKAKEQLPVAKQYLEQAKENIVRIDKEIESKGKQKEKLLVDLEKIKEQTTKFAEHQFRCNEIEKQVKEIKDMLNSIYSTIGSLTQQLEALEAKETERKQLKAELEPTAKRANYYDVLKKAFSLDGIPFSIVRSVVPELSQIANNILTQMTGGKMTLEIKLDKIVKSTGNEVNALEIWITHYERGTMPYLSFSGGQKVRAALSGAFALSELKSIRGNIKSNMFFVDEPSFLDSEGVNAYCDALEILAGRNMRVIAISHDPQMQSRFPQKILVTKGSNGSKIKFCGM
jgi:exonuclease SbcC